MYKIILAIVLFLFISADVKTYKVTLSKSSEGTNRTVYIQATDSSQARDIAKDQNPGWAVLTISEVKAQTKPAS